MPSMTTHFVQSELVFKKMSREQKSHMKGAKKIYNLFAQSHDMLFYYIFDFNDPKRISELGHHAHHHKTQDYILNIIKTIKKYHLEDRPDLIAYLYGVITHYATDTTCHPYIFYKTGVYRKDEEWTHIYKGEHNHIEKDLDAIFYERHFKRKYNKCNLNKEIIPKVKFSYDLTKMLNVVYEKTYDVEDIGKYYYKSVKQCRMINRLFINDRFGIKRFFYFIFDFITQHKFGYVSSYSTHITKPNKKWLNKEHKEWNHPCFKDLKFDTSFDDLMKESISKSLDIIEKVDQVLFEDKPISSLKKVILNTDYATGIECNDPNGLYYFEH